MPLKVKRLARDPERFVWAVSMAQTRHINFRIRIGSLIQNANMFAPYAGIPFLFLFPFLPFTSKQSIKSMFLFSQIC